MGTNFTACSDYREAVVKHGPLVPDKSAHVFAGITRKRWWELKDLHRFPLVVVGGVEFVPLSWIEQRSTQRGRPGLLFKLQNGLISPCPADWPLTSRQK